MFLSYNIFAERIHLRHDEREQIPFVKTWRDREQRGSGLPSAVQVQATSRPGGAVRSWHPPCHLPGMRVERHRRSQARQASARRCRCPTRPRRCYQMCNKGCIAALITWPPFRSCPFRASVARCMRCSREMWSSAATARAVNASTHSSSVCHGSCMCVASVARRASSSDYRAARELWRARARRVTGSYKISSVHSVTPPAHQRAAAGCDAHIRVEFGAHRAHWALGSHVWASVAPDAVLAGFARFAGALRANKFTRTRRGAKASKWDTLQLAGAKARGLICILWQEGTRIRRQQSRR
jgi:hypothetical protein